MDREEEKQEGQETKMKLGFFEKWKLKRNLNKIKKSLDIQKKAVIAIREKADDLNDKETENLDEQKKEIIRVIIGDKKKGEKGLAEIFEISGKDGKEVTREELEEEPIDELINLLEDLVTALEKEV